MILNDDDALLLTFKILLKSPGVQIFTASNYSGAVKHFSDEKIDVILSDINLGDDGPDGYDFLKEVRARDQALPVYMVSGYSESEEAPKAKSMGATGYLQLPVDKEQLLKIIN